MKAPRGAPGSPLGPRHGSFCHISLSIRVNYPCQYWVFFLYLIQNKFPPPSHGSRDAGMGSMDTMSVSQSEGEKTNNSSSTLDVSTSVL